MNSVKVSIVTVSYNSAATIARTIESILDQTSYPYEYIIQDGQSTDNTLEICESYRERMESNGIKYQIVSDKDAGIYDAMNKGIAITSGDVVGMINSDDWYEDNAIEVVSKTYIEDSFDYMYADLRVVNGEKVHIKKSKMDKFPSSRHWNHPTMFVKRSVYDEVQYNNDHLYGDFELMIHLRKSGYKVKIVNIPLANFAFGGISTKKDIKMAYERFCVRYGIYRRCGYGVLSVVECAYIELGKYLMA